LGRANLIVGKNNVGKTSVLEALRLYAQPGLASVLVDLLETRDEIDVTSAMRDSILGLKFQEGSLSFSVGSLFHGRKVPSEKSQYIKIGPLGNESRNLTISPGWLEERQKNVLSGERDEPYDEGGRFHLFYEIGNLRLSVPITNAREFARFALNQAGEFEQDAVDTSNAPPVFFIGANGLAPDIVGELWDSIALTDQEEQVVSALTIIASNLERLVLVSRGKSSPARIPVVKLRGLSGSVPLRSLGDGMNRLFGIALALVNAKNGFLLIDEIENGIHYSVQPDVWRLIFQTAEKLNVQVFATTHSWDCIKAFQEAAAENKEVKGVLIRLAEKGGEIRVGEFDEQELGVAVEGRIEVR
jgi:ABC-type branched-subunit amino acid transport system ATPase component